LYCGFWFFIIFLLLFPFFVLFIQRKEWHAYALVLNRVWAKILFFLAFKQIDIEWRFTPEKNKTYVFTPNHTSFLDIATMGILHLPIVFVGKSSIAKVPVFGYMYTQLHVTVNRNNYKSRYEVIQKGSEKLRQGLHLAIFPEGGIRSPNPPRMASFKDGAFRIAIQENAPIVPVTLPNNWKVFPDDGNFVVHWGNPKVILHPPIETEHLGTEDIKWLKEQVFTILNNELNHYNPQSVSNNKEINT
jgi:1-acyl-sn-glycerol-3-phosphate acyltransferase